jgi:ribosomal protein L7Ae-like RNA K-turn-binding protein
VILLIKKGLDVLGLAHKAGKVVVGEEAVLKSLKQNRLKLVLVAKDASPRTIDKFDKKCFFYQTPINLEYTYDELSHAIGKPMCKILGLTDQGFSEILKSKLEVL